MKLANRKFWCFCSNNENIHFRKVVSEGEGMWVERAGETTSVSTENSPLNPEEQFRQMLVNNDMNKLPETLFKELKIGISHSYYQTGRAASVVKGVKNSDSEYCSGTSTKNQLHYTKVLCPSESLSLILSFTVFKIFHCIFLFYYFIPHFISIKRCPKLPRSNNENSADRCHCGTYFCEWNNVYTGLYVQPSSQEYLNLILPLSSLIS